MRRGVARFEAQHAVDEHRPVEVFGVEAVERRLELRMRQSWA